MDHLEWVAGRLVLGIKTSPQTIIQLYNQPISLSLFQEFNSEPHKYRSRFSKCSECEAVDVEYQNIDSRKSDLVVEKFCGYDPVRKNNTLCRTE